MKEGIVKCQISPKEKGAFKMQTFVKVPHDTVLRLGEVAKTERCPSLFPVYLALLFHADRKGKCFPSYQRIKEISGIRSDASVRKALLLLEKYGFIKKQPRHGRHGNSTYYLQTSINEEAFTEETSSINEEVTATNEKCSSMNEEPNFNECSSKLQSLKSKTSINEEELESFNYNHITISHSTKDTATSESEKRNQYLSFEEREKWEKKIKETVNVLLGRDIVPLEQYFLEKALFSIPGAKLLQFLENFYLKHPQTFRKQGLFILEGAGA